MPFTKFFSFKNRLFRKNFFFKIVLTKTTRETQKLRFLRGKLNQIKNFFVQSFFLKSAFMNYFFPSKSYFLKIFSFFKIWGVVNFSFQNLTGCFFSIQNVTRFETFKSKLDMLG